MTTEPNRFFPDRPQGWGMPTERKARAAAREFIGGKAKQNLAFITLTDGIVWGWLSASSAEYSAAYRNQR